MRGIILLSLLLHLVLASVVCTVNAGNSAEEAGMEVEADALSGEMNVAVDAQDSSDVATSVDAFLQLSSTVDAGTPAIARPQPAIASQFLVHHLKAKRTFSTGFEPSHIQYTMNGLTPPAQCVCSINANATDIAIEDKTCKLPRRFWVSTAQATTKPFTPASKRHVSRLLGDISAVRLVRTAGASFSCIDGRTPHASTESLLTESRSLKSFGGDFGEFVLMLTVLRRHSHGRMYEPTVDQIFRNWIDTSRKSYHKRPYFYYHTDVEALSRIASQLGYEVMHRNSSWVSPINDGGSSIIYHSPSGRDTRSESEQLPFLDFTNPPLHLQGILLESLILPENQGCAHLRLLMTYERLYGVPLKMVQWALKAYFRLLWNKDEIGAMTDGKPLYYKLKFVVSKGVHKERAWFNIKNTRTCDARGVAPVVATAISDEASWSEEDAKNQVWDRETVAALSTAPAAASIAAPVPKSAGARLRPDEVFMYHPMAVQHLREEFTDYVLGKQAKLKFSKVLHEINELAENVESRTQKLLMRDMPEYNVRVV